MSGKKRRPAKKTVKKPKEKTVTRGTRKEKEATAASTKEKSSLGIAMPDLKGNGFPGELKKMKVLTPHSVASRLGLRLSVAKQVLKELERKGIVKYVSKSRNLKIYKPAD